MKKLTLIIAIVFSGMLVQGQIKTAEFHTMEEAYYNENNFNAKGIEEHWGNYKVEWYQDRIVLSALGEELNFVIESGGYNQDDEAFIYHCSLNGVFYQVIWADGYRELEFYELNANEEGWYYSLVLTGNDLLYIGRI